MGVGLIGPSDSSSVSGWDLPHVRRIGLGRPSRSLLAQPRPAEAIKRRRAGRAPILPLQIDKLQVAVDQVCVDRL
eukprot:8113785-Alexandrium_andersonii.AAC.1